MPQKNFSNVSKEAQAFLKRLMAIEAEDRPTAQEALQDPWIRDIESDPNMNKIVHS